MKEIFYDWGGLNVWLFKLINGLGGAHAYDSFMLFITQFGDKHNFKYYFALMLCWCIGELGVKKLHNEPITRPDWNATGAVLITLVMGFIVCAALTGMPKVVTHLPRPFAVPEIYQLMAQGKLFFLDKAPPEAEYFASFPSGHASTIAFIVAGLWHKFSSRPAHMAGAVLVLLVCWSRIAIGMHFPADVLAGVVVGVVSAHYVRRYVYRMMRVPLPGQIVAPPVIMPQPRR